MARMTSVCTPAKSNAAPHNIERRVWPSRLELEAQPPAVGSLGLGDSMRVWSVATAGAPIQRALNQNDNPATSGLAQSLGATPATMSMS